MLGKDDSEKERFNFRPASEAEVNCAKIWEIIPGREKGQGKVLKKM